MLQLISSFISNEDGATAVEYGLIAAFIVMAAMTAMSALDVSLQSLFVAVSNQVDGAVQASGGTN